MFTVESVREAQVHPENPFQPLQGDYEVAWAKRKQIDPEECRAYLQEALHAVFGEPKHPHTFEIEKDWDDREGERTWCIVLDNTFYLYPTLCVIRRKTIAGYKCELAIGWGLDVAVHIPATREEPADCDWKDQGTYDSLHHAIKALVLLLVDEVWDNFSEVQAFKEEEQYDR